MREKMFILNQFRSHDCRGIECELMFKMAAESGCYTPETYGSDFSKALSELCDVESICNDSGDWIYNVFRLKEAWR